MMGEFRWDFKSSFMSMHVKTAQQKSILNIVPKNSGDVILPFLFSSCLWKENQKFPNIFSQHKDRTTNGEKTI